MILKVRSQTFDGSEGAWARGPPILPPSQTNLSPTISRSDRAAPANDSHVEVCTEMEDERKF